MSQCISSASTFWLKYVVPGLFIPSIGIQSIVLLIDPFHSTLPRDVGLDHASFVTFWSVAWVVSSAILLWHTGTLKRVCIGENELLVSNFRTEWRIPSTAIESVSQPFRLIGRRVKIRPHSDFGCGTNVKFVPKRLWFTPFWREHPVIGELRRLAGIEGEEGA